MINKEKLLKMVEIGSLRVDHCKQDLKLWWVLWSRFNQDKNKHNTPKYR
jgi:hypothetical protein